MMTEQDLKSIVTLYNSGSFHKAAELLFISQPALSSSISNLERDLNVALFERSRKGITPNPICESLIPLAIEILEMINNFKTLCYAYSISTNPSFQNTPIIISAYPLISAVILPELFSMLKIHAPNLNLTLNNLSMDNSLPIPKDNEVIIFIKQTNDNSQVPDGVLYEQICTVEPIILMHKDYLTPLPKYIDEETLVTLPIISILRNNSLASVLTNSMIQHLSSLNPKLNIIDVPSNSVCISFLKKKLGVSFNLQFNSYIPIPTNKDLVNIPLRHTNEHTFALMMSFSANFPDELRLLISNLVKQSLCFL